MAINDGFTLQESVERLAKIDWIIGKAPWPGVVWHPGRKTMITNKEAQDLCARLILYMIGGEEDTTELRKKYAEAINDEKAKLPKRVTE